MPTLTPRAAVVYGALLNLGILALYLRARTWEPEVAARFAAILAAALAVDAVAGLRALWPRVVLVRAPWAITTRAVARRAP